MTNHNTNNNFTYLNDFNGSDGVTDMAANLNIDIAAVNYVGNTTTNYIETCYAKDSNLTLTFNPFSIVPTDSLTHMLYYNEIDGSKSDILLPSPQTNISSLPEPLQSTFANFKSADNGTANLEYKLNFNRSIDQVVQAFKMELTDVNMTDTDLVEGNQSSITGQTIYMHYAKARPSVGIGNTYETVESVANTPVLIHVYCDPTITMCSTLNLNSPAPGGWWLSTGHNADDDDGYVILKDIDPPVDVIEGSGEPYFDTNATTIVANGGKDNNVIIFRGSNPTFPLTVNIELDISSDTWLIHNPFGIPTDPSPFYKVKFITPSIWVGAGGTGSVVDTNVNTNTHKRSNW